MLLIKEEEGIGQWAKEETRKGNKLKFCRKKKKLHVQNKFIDATIQIITIIIYMKVYAMLSILSCSQHDCL